MAQGVEDSTIAYRLSQAETQIKDLDAQIEKMRAEADARERNRLKWGVSVLGAVVLFLLSKLAPPLEDIIFKGPRE